MSGHGEPFKCLRCFHPFRAEWQERDACDMRDEPDSSGYPECPKCKSREYVNTDYART